MKIILIIVLISIFNIIAQTNVSKYEDKETQGETEAKTKAKAKAVFDIDFDKLNKSRESIIQQPQMLEQAFDKEIDSTKYILGPGDQLLIKIWGILDDQFLTEITPEGYLIIPSIAEVMVSGKALSEASQIIKIELNRSFKNASFSIRLVRMRKFRVYVVGEIEMPGTYYLRASDRVVDAIQLAGGRCRKRPTSVTTPTVCMEPRSASLVTTAGLMSTHTTRTHDGSMLPTPML